MEFKSAVTIDGIMVQMSKTLYAKFNLECLALFKFEFIDNTHAFLV